MNHPAGACRHEPVRTIDRPTRRGDSDRMRIVPDPEGSDVPPRTIRVVIADDSYLMRQALEHVLAETDGIEIAGSCSDRDGLLMTVEAERPDVVVTDIRMPPTDT